MAIRIELLKNIYVFLAQVLYTRGTVCHAVKTKGVTIQMKIDDEYLQHRRMFLIVRVYE